MLPYRAPAPLVLPQNRNEIARRQMDEIVQMERQLQQQQEMRTNSVPSGSASNFAVKRKCEDYGPNSVETIGTTQHVMETWAFLWNIKCYSAFNGFSEEIKSPIFKGGSKSNHSWQLKLNPKRVEEELEYLAVYLILADFGDCDSSQQNKKLMVRFQVTVLDADGRPGRQVGNLLMSGCEYRKNSSWGYDKFILCSELNSPIRRLLENNELKLHCRVWLEGDVEHEICSGGSSQSGPSKEVRARRRGDLLAADFGKLFRQSLFADVTIVTPNKTFPAHKAVLTASSSVFASMFNNGGNEEKEVNSVEIQGFDDEVVEGMLEYVYTSETSILKTRAADLLLIAEKYDIAALKEDCVFTTEDSLTPDNAAGALLLAEKHSHAHLKQKVIDYINCNKVDVIKTESFLQLAITRPDLFIDLYLSTE